MRRIGKRLSGLVVLASLALSLSAVVVHAQQPTTITMTPTLTREAGLAGTVTITPAGPNQVTVAIRVTGLKPNDVRASHIHKPGTETTFGPCDTNGAVVYPLPDVKADASGVGTNSATVTFDPAKGIPTAGWYVNVHTGSGASTGLGVICGKIAASLGTAAAAGAAASPAAGAAAPAAAAPAAAAPAAAALPRTGTGGPAASNGMLLAVLALVGIALGSTGLAISRRR